MKKTHQTFYNFYFLDHFFKNNFPYFSLIFFYTCIVEKRRKTVEKRRKEKNTFLGKCLERP